MRKVIILSFLFILVGCNQRDILQCENGFESDGLKYKTNIKLIFNNNKLEKENMIINVELDESYQSYIDTVINSFDNSFKEYHDVEGIDYTIDRLDNSFNINLSIIINDMNDTDKEKLGLLDISSNYDEAKEQFENEGYTCK